MKKYIILTIVLVAVLVSCTKKWLEVVPMGTQLAITTDDYDKLMNDPALYQNTSAGGLSEVLQMGDEIAAQQPFYGNRDQDNDLRERFFEWRDSLFPTPNVQPRPLRDHLELQYEINKVIKEVMGSTGGTEARKKEIQAEALAVRAWSTFMMANFYCKPYVASTASTDPGFPLVTKPDVAETNFTRGTVQETYNQIIKDFKDALVSIPMKQGFVTRMSKPAVEGLLGKVYLFMGKYNDALPLLNAALADAMANGQASLYDYNQTFGPGGAFLPISNLTGPASPFQNVTDLKESVLARFFYSGAYAGNQTGNNGLVLTPSAQALYGSSDWRLKFYTDTNPDNSVNAAGRIRKYGIRYSRWGLQLPELYLLLAECKARTNDLPGAVADVETLRRNRMPVADAAVPTLVAGDQTALIKFIIEERIREFAMEGYRWLDMRRLSVDPLFPTAPVTHTVYNEDGSTTIYTLNQPTRYTMKFPRYITELNPNMPNNP